MPLSQKKKKEKIVFGKRRTVLIIEEIKGKQN